MANEFRIFIALSLCIHAGVFLAFSLKTKRAPYVVLPVELMFYRPLSAPASAPAQAAAPAAPAPKEKEIALPTEKKKAQKEAPKKAAPEPPKPKEEAGKKGGADSDAPRSASPSSPISVDAARFPYAYYTNLIVKKIGRSWQWSTEYGRLKAVIYFKILRSGEIGAVEIKQASGDRLFDEQALRAVQLASPFPPLPVGYNGDDLGVYFEFTYRE